MSSAPRRFCVSSAGLRVDACLPATGVSHRSCCARSRRRRISHVVDTSHFPLRARELQQLDGIELFIIFLVRDPQAVVASNLAEISPHEKAERRLRTLAMNANLWLTQLVSLLVFLRQPPERRMFLRHEEFLDDPEGVLKALLARIGADVELPDLTALRIGTPLEGNRLIRSEVIALRSTRGRDRHPPGRAEADSLLTTLLQLPWRPLLARLSPAAVPASGGETQL